VQRPACIGNVKERGHAHFIRVRCGVPGRTKQRRFAQINKTPGGDGGKSEFSAAMMQRMLKSCHGDGNGRSAAEMISG